MASAIDFLPTISSCQAVSQMNLATARWRPHAGYTQWGEASIDLRLGRQFTTYRKDISGITLSVAGGLGSLGDLNLWNTEERDYFDLVPGELVLALTHESITVPKSLIGLVE